MNEILDCRSTQLSDERSAWENCRKHHQISFSDKTIKNDLKFFKEERVNVAHTDYQDDQKTLDDLEQELILYYDMWAKNRNRLSRGRQKEKVERDKIYYIESAKRLIELARILIPRERNGKLFNK